MRADLPRHFFDQLRGSLGLEPTAADEVIRELETHAEDRLEELRNAGAEDDLARVLRRDFGRPEVLARLLREAHTQASWHEALFAAAPFLLAALLFATHLWHNPLALAAFALVTVTVTLGASWGGKPSWFYTWAGMSLTILVVCGYLAFLILRAYAPELAEGTKNPLILLGVSGAVAYYPLAVLVLLWCTLVVVRRDWLLASIMLSPLPPVAMWLAAVHGAGGLLAPAWSHAAGYDNTLAGAYLGMALAAAMIIRAQSRTLKLAALVSSALLILTAASGAREPASVLAVVASRGVLLLGFLFVPAVIDGLVSARLDGDSDQGSDRRGHG